jgi:uncharacterized protein (DUF488 family)
MPVVVDRVEVGRIAVSETLPLNRASIPRSRRTPPGMALSMTFYTIGYGGRVPAEFASLLVSRGVRSVVDVRIHPDRASMGSYVKARSAEKGIEKLLADRGIVYRSLLELGNLFRDLDDWRPSYRALFEHSGELLVARLAEMPEPFCLMCAEKRVAECHRQVIAEFLAATRGWSVEHIE